MFYLCFNLRFLVTCVTLNLWKRKTDLLDNFFIPQQTAFWQPHQHNWRAGVHYPKPRPNNVSHTRWHTVLYISTLEVTHALGHSLARRPVGPTLIRKCCHDSYISEWIELKSSPFKCPQRENFSFPIWKSILKKMNFGETLLPFERQANFLQFLLRAQLSSILKIGTQLVQVFPGHVTFLNILSFAAVFASGFRAPSSIDIDMIALFLNWKKY